MVAHRFALYEIVRRPAAWTESQDTAKDALEFAK